MAKKWKKIIADEKFTDEDVSKALELYKQSRSEGSDDQEQEDQSDAEEDSAEEESSDVGGDKPQLTMDDLNKMIKSAVSDALKGNKPKQSKKTPPKPNNRKIVNHENIGIEFGEFGLIPTKSIKDYKK